MALAQFPYFRPFRIFRYLTFRTAFATLTALLIGLVVRSVCDPEVARVSDRPVYPRRGSTSHQKKAGTPTMGGVWIAISVLLPTLLWADLSDPLIWMVTLSMLAFRYDRFRG